MHSPIKNNTLRIFVSFLFVVYAFLLIKCILLRTSGDLKSHFLEYYTHDRLKKNISQSNYIPFYTAYYYFTGSDPLRYTKENLVGNVILFFPFGIFLPLIFNKIRGFQSIIIISFLVSVTFEIIQLFTILGNFDVDDIILNVLGAALGFGIFLLAAELIATEKPIRLR
jgi:glycopeptide antibiotics resistance protein